MAKLLHRPPSSFLCLQSDSLRIRDFSRGSPRSCHFRFSDSAGPDVENLRNFRVGEEIPKFRKQGRRVEVPAAVDGRSSPLSKGALWDGGRNAARRETKIHFSLGASRFEREVHLGAFRVGAALGAGFLVSEMISQRAISGTLRMARLGPERRRKLRREFASRLEEFACQLRTDVKLLQTRSSHESDKDPVVSREGASYTVPNVSIPDLRGGVVALGKFDALHIGHRTLTERAAAMGPPILLSFSGMADILGWEPRLPVAASCDRKRIMEIWAERSGVIPQEFSLEFVKVRSLSPREFVQKLSKDLQIKGVVAGANYRFGYKAAGDAADLVNLCNEYGLQSFVVDPVMDKDEKVFSMNGEFSGSSREKGQVSSTRIRKALALGNMERVANLLGRRHRLVLKAENCILEKDRILVPVRSALNQYPAEGCYRCTLVGTGEQLLSVDGEAHERESKKCDHLFGSVEVQVGPAWIEISAGDVDAKAVLQRTLVALEF